MKFFRKLITLTAMALVIGSVYLFIQTERLYKQLNEMKPRAELNFSDWEKQNNCLEDPLPCADYSTQFKDWLAQFELYKESKEKTPQFRAYLFLKELDELYAPNLNSGGKAVLALACGLVLLWFLLIARLFGEKKKINIPSIKTHLVAPPKSNDKLEAQTLLRKAAECAENEPKQAINYFEQALKGSLSAKLTAPTLLMCGSLRLKNKIGKKQGRKQLNKIISNSPQSLEAKKAKTMLETFK
jgi:tetratricopeptide (TPR) repeat protein